MRRTFATIPPFVGHARFRDRGGPATAKSGILRYLLHHAATRGLRVVRFVPYRDGGVHEKSIRFGWGCATVRRSGARGRFGSQAACLQGGTFGAGLQLDRIVSGRSRWLRLVEF